MSEEDAIAKDVELGRQLNQVACNTCGATVGWVNGNRYRREVESKREALKQTAALTAEVARLRGLLKQTQDYHEYCGFCCHTIDFDQQNHDADCELAAALSGTEQGGE